MNTLDIEELCKLIFSGDRKAIATAITLVESTKHEDQDSTNRLLTLLGSQQTQSIRIGISGPPGVGKSTFIEAIGHSVLESDERLAILAIDPSSSISGGSILGDKTRMESLSRNENTFIRPSPSGGNLGGVHRSTRESVSILEAAGYSVILIETVGVGQAETEVFEMTDVFLVLLSPGGGDELQGIKRGIIELADILVVNKADGNLEATSKSTVLDYKNALKLLKPRIQGWAVPGRGRGDPRLPPRAESEPTGRAAQAHAGDLRQHAAVHGGDRRRALPIRLLLERRDPRLRRRRLGGRRRHGRFRR